MLLVFFETGLYYVGLAGTCYIGHTGLEFVVVLLPLPPTTLVYVQVGHRINCCHTKLRQEDCYEFQAEILFQKNKNMPFFLTLKNKQAWNAPES